MNFKAVIFDLDGTVVDTDRIWEEALKQLLVNKGVRVVPEQLQEIERTVMGLALPYSSQFVKDYFKLPEPVDVLVQDYVNIVRARYQMGINFVQGFTDFHRVVTAEHKLKSGIATNANDETIAWTKNFVPLEQFFGEHIYNISHVDNKVKPDPAIYLHTAKQLVVEPEFCLVIEDSANGIAASKSAGMLCIGINTSGRRHLLSEADVIVDGYHEIDLIRVAQAKKI